MATMYNNEKSGVLFINDKKNANDPEDKQPNFTGNIEIGGIKYSLSAWTREYEKDGEQRKLISMKATHPDDMKKFSAKEETPTPNNNDIPF